MAFVGEEQTQAVDTGVGTEEEDTYTVELPDLTDDAAVNALKASLEAHKHIFGVKSLMLNLHLYLHHDKLCKAAHAKMQTNIGTINGTNERSYFRPSELTEAERKERALRLGSRKYFSALLDQDSGIAMLKMQCQLFNIVYDDYEDLEDIVEALVDKQMELVNS